MPLSHDFLLTRLTSRIFALGLVMPWGFACAQQGTEVDSNSPGSAHGDASSCGQSGGGSCDLLRQQVRRLEKRVRILEESQGAVARSDSNSPRRSDNIPVVRMKPEVPVVENNRPEQTRKSTTVGTLPNSGVPEHLTRPQYDYSSFADSYVGNGGATGSQRTSGQSQTSQAPDDEGVSKRYRLVGSRLIDLTRNKPKQSQSRRKSGKAKGDPMVRQYKKAMETYKAGQLASAKLMFSELARKYPDHGYADNALYWQGEVAYDQAQYSEALSAFTRVVERYAGGNKAPDALLKIGLCYGRLGDRANAYDVLSQLIEAYPKASASKLAERKLPEFSP